MNAELVAWAMAYAANGIPVFAVELQQGSVCQRGTEASTDPVQIKDWWRRWPLAMIAAPTGERSGFVVLDIDVKSGVDGFEALRAKGLSIPRDAPHVVTPSTGLHIYFDHWRAGLRNSVGEIGPGVDVRAEGGMVLLPPSRPRLDGPDYHFAEGWEKPMRRLFDG